MAYPIGEFKPVNISGNLAPFKNGIPVVMELSGEPDELWVCIFTTIEKLNNFMEICGQTHYTVKQIIDGLDFKNSILESGKFRIAQNPHSVVVDDNLRTRWTEIL